MLFTLNYNNLFDKRTYNWLPLFIFFLMRNYHNCISWRLLTYTKSSLILNKPSSCLLQNSKYTLKYSTSTSIQTHTIPLSLTIHFNNLDKNVEPRPSFNVNPGNYLLYEEAANIIQQHNNQTPLILLHGLLGAKRNFNSFSKLLHSPIVVTVDLRNHGQSPHHKDMSFNSMAKDIYHTLDLLKLDQAFVAGHSLGGKVAMTLALQHPDRVTKLISLDMPNAAFSTSSDFPSKNVNFVSNLVRMLYNLLDDCTKYTTRSEIKLKIQALSPKIPPTMLGFLMQNLHQKVDGTWAWVVNIDAIYKSLDTHLFSWPDDHQIKIYKGPSLFLKGQMSNYITDHHLENIRKQFPTSQIETIIGAGHWIHSEKPQETADAMNKFLNTFNTQ